MPVLPCAPILATKFAGYDLGYTAGLYTGSQTISESMGLVTGAINRLRLPPDQAKQLLDTMPVASGASFIIVLLA